MKNFIYDVLLTIVHVETISAEDEKHAEEILQQKYSWTDGLLDMDIALVKVENVETIDE